MKPTTNRQPLSDTQAKVLAYLGKFLELNDQLPTIAKIAEDFGWASSNSADTHLKAMEKKGYLARNELHNLMLADRPATEWQAIEKQRIYLVQAWEMLEDYAVDQRSRGNDSIADGALASAHAIGQLLVPVKMGIDLARGPDQTAYWPPRKEATHG